MPKLFGLLDRFKGLKDSFTGAIATVVAVKETINWLLDAKDKIDDDLDGDGKAEYVNIMDKIKEIEDESVAYFKDLLADIMDIVHRVEKLQAHVMSHKEAK